MPGEIFIIAIFESVLGDFPAFNPVYHGQPSHHSHKYEKPSQLSHKFWAFVLSLPLATLFTVGEFFVMSSPVNYFRFLVGAVTLPTITPPLPVQEVPSFFFFLMGRLISPSSISSFFGKIPNYDFRIIHPAFIFFQLRQSYIPTLGGITPPPENFESPYEVQPMDLLVTRIPEYTIYQVGGHYPSYTYLLSYPFFHIFQDVH